MATDAIAPYLKPTKTPTEAQDPSAPVIESTDAELAGRNDTAGNPVVRMRSSDPAAQTLLCSILAALAQLTFTGSKLQVDAVLEVESIEIGKVDQGAAGASAWKVDGSAVTQPVSAAALPLPAGASTEATLAAIKAKTDNLDVALSTRTKPADTQPVSAAALPLPAGAATQTTLASVLSALPQDVDGNLKVGVATALIPRDYDEIDLSYTGTNLTGVLYKKATVLVATLTLSYTGSTLTGVVRT